MKIDGMSCGHCVSQVTKALRDLAGVEVENVTMGAATVAHDPITTSVARITQALEDQGYSVVSTTP